MKYRIFDFLQVLLIASQFWYYGIEYWYYGINNSLLCSMVVVLFVAQSVMCSIYGLYMVQHHVLPLLIVSIYVSHRNEPSFHGDVRIRMLLFFALCDLAYLYLKCICVHLIIRVIVYAMRKLLKIKNK